MVAVIFAPPIGLFLMPDTFLALSAYVPAIALLITWLQRHNDGTLWRVCMVINSLALVAGLVILIFGVFLAGWGTLVFMGEG